MSGKKIADVADDSDKENEWEDVFSDRFQFNDDNDTIEGELIAKGEQQMQNSKVGTYSVQVDDDGEKVVLSFLGSTVLDRLMAQVEVGDKVRIMYKGEEKTGQNRKMKNFSVQKQSKKK